MSDKRPKRELDAELANVTPHSHKSAVGISTSPRNEESDKLFAAIHRNKELFTAERAHSAFSKVRRRNSHSADTKK